MSICKWIHTLFNRRGRMTACSATQLWPRTALQPPKPKASTRLKRLRTLNQRLSRPASVPVPHKPPNLKQKTTVPPGKFRFGAGAPNACLHAALANNIAGGKTSKEPECSRLMTATWMRPAILWRETLCDRARR